MKRLKIEEATLEACVRHAQEDRVLLTRDGRPVAFVVGLTGSDDARLRRGASDTFENDYRAADATDLTRSERECLAEVARRREGKHPPAPHRASLILILGLLGMFFFPSAPMAWVMGERDLWQMRDGAMDPSGEPLTNFGRFLGMAVAILMLAFVLGAITLRVWSRTMLSA